MQQHVVTGKTQFDQPWVDDVSEAVIAGCNRPRPQPRPAHWDAAPSPKPPATAPKKKPSVWDRARGHIGM